MRRRRSAGGSRVAAQRTPWERPTTHRDLEHLLRERDRRRPAVIHQPRACAPEQRQYAPPALRVVAAAGGIDEGFRTARAAAAEAAPSEVRKRDASRTLPSASALAASIKIGISCGLRSSNGAGRAVFACERWSTNAKAACCRHNATAAAAAALLGRPQREARASHGAPSHVNTLKRLVCAPERVLRQNRRQHLQLLRDVHRVRHGRGRATRDAVFCRYTCLAKA